MSAVPPSGTKDTSAEPNIASSATYRTRSTSCRGIRRSRCTARAERDQPSRPACSKQKDSRTSHTSPAGLKRGRRPAFPYEQDRTMRKTSLTIVLVALLPAVVVAQAGGRGGGRGGAA